MTWWLIATVAWILCGIFSYGVTFACYQRYLVRLSHNGEDEYAARRGEEKRDRITAFLTALFGPIGFIVTLFMFCGLGFWGVRFRSYTLEECAEDVRRFKKEHAK